MPREYNLYLLDTLEAIERIERYAQRDGLRGVHREDPYRMV